VSFGIVSVWKAIKGMVELSVGSELVLEAIAESIRREPVLMDQVPGLIARYSAEYARKKFNLDVEAETLEELWKRLAEVGVEHPEVAAVYGICKAESTIIGAVGVMSRRIAKGIPKVIIEKTGLTEHLEGAKDLYDVLTRYKSILVGIGHMKEEEMTITDTGDNEVELKLENCFFADACTSLNEEGVYYILGSIPCAGALVFAGVGESILKRSFDVRVGDYRPPNCRVKIFEL